MVAAARIAKQDSSDCHEVTRYPGVAMFGVEEATQIRETLAALERALERYERTLEVLFVLAAARERRMDAGESLAGIQTHVRSLQDLSLAVLYDMLMATQPGRQEDTHAPQDYGAFVERLVGLASSAATDLYQADIRLIATLGASAAARPSESPSSVAI